MTWRAIRPPVNICAKKRKVAVSFHLHGELNVLVDTGQVVRGVPQPFGAMWLFDKSIVHLTESAEGLRTAWFSTISKSSVKNLALVRLSLGLHEPFRFLTVSCWTSSAVYSGRTPIPVSIPHRISSTGKIVEVTA
jgi:hypothetical protein